MERSKDGVLVSKDGVVGRLSRPWLPAGASLVLDFDNNRFFWGGEERALSDLTASGSGYYMDDVSWWNSSWTFAVEYTPPETLADEETMFSLADMAGTERLEFLLAPGAGGAARLYANPPNGACNIFYHARADDMSPDVVSPRQRAGFSITPGTVPWSGVTGNLITQVGTTVPGDFVGLNRAGFGYLARFNIQYFTGALHKIFAWPMALTPDQLAKVLTTGDRRHVHMLGDSFANSMIEIALLALTTDRYIPFSRDGVGSTTLAQQAARFAAMPSRYYDATLLIMDGVATDDAATALAALDDIVSRLTHSRWAYIEPGFGEDHKLGTSNRLALDAWLAAIQSYCGADHYVPTYDAMLAANDASTEDLQDVTDGIWPRSLRSDGLHPNEAGMGVLAATTLAFCEAKGWM